MAPQGGGGGAVLPGLGCATDSQLWCLKLMGRNPVPFLNLMNTNQVLFVTHIVLHIGEL